MDPQNQTDNNKLNNLKIKFQELLKKKWFLPILVLLLIIIISILMSLSKTATPEKSEELVPTDIMSKPTQIFIAPTFTPEQQKKIEEQQKADTTVGNREKEIKTNYPWFVKLPLRGEKYFVYFDPNTKVFTGLLYPKKGEEVAPLKTEVIGKLKNLYNVPVEKFTYDWKTFSQ